MQTQLGMASKSIVGCKLAVHMRCRRDSVTLHPDLATIHLPSRDSTIDVLVEIFMQALEAFHDCFGVLIEQSIKRLHKTSTSRRHKHQ